MVVRTGAGNCPEFAKAVIIIRKSKKDRQHTGLVWFMVFNATINISNISWRSVLLVEETEVPGENHRSVLSDNTMDKRKSTNNYMYLQNTTQKTKVKQHELH